MKCRRQSHTQQTFIRLVIYTQRGWAIWKLYCEKDRRW